MKQALISVFDKEGVAEFSQKLIQNNYQIISSGGTAKHLRKNGVEVKEIEDITGFPEILNGRVKTLHPKIHGGILARRDDASHIKQIEDHEISSIDLVAVDLYPFEEGLKRELSDSEMIELIDIGGPSMLRSAAKNFQDVIVISSIKDYSHVISQIEKGETPLEFKRKLAEKVFDRLTQYNFDIANYLSGNNKKALFGEKVTDLRYGENPHQKAAFYKEKGNEKGIWADYNVIQGKALSFNNIRDIDATWSLVSEFENETVCVCTKHSTPCGVAVAEDSSKAYQRAYSCDSQSIFGGVVGFNSEVCKKTANELYKTFLEVIIAPSFSSQALEKLSSKKNLRLIETQQKASQNEKIIQVDGGFLVQDKDLSTFKELDAVTDSKPNEETVKNIIFGLKVVKHVKSNAIVVIQDLKAVGIGGGQVNRFFAAKQAIENGKGAAVLISDGFFPFDDIVRLASENGIRTIVQPGGSVKDKDSITYCNEAGISMVLTHERHFLH